MTDETSGGIVTEEMDGTVTDESDETGITACSTN